MQIFNKSIEVWNILLPDHRHEIASYRELLNTEELERAEKFIKPFDAERFVLCRGMLRRVLADALGKSPSSLHFNRNTHGKPFLEDGELEFNVSHSRDRLLITVTEGCRVGVDIEFRRSGLNLSAIAGRWFSPEENSFFSSTENPEKRFFEIWAKKEAYVKALGAGIYRELSTFTVPLETGNARSELSADGKWFFQTLEIDSGYAAAVVSEAPVRPVHIKNDIV